jgi:hypothetical protein
VSGRRFSISTLTLALVLAIGLPIATQGQVAPSEIVGITWHHQGPSGQVVAVSIRGFSPEILRTIQQGERTPEQWAEVFSIRLDSADPQPLDRPAMLGTYRVDGDSLRFTPRFPLDLGKLYVASFRPSKLIGGSGTDQAWRHIVKKPERAPTLVTSVTPSIDTVPENLLKFYLYFSHPMSRGEVYDRVRLLKADGQAVADPFLRLGEELWDPSGTRLTLLIDPGRIKRGLQPREQFGPVLEAGRVYTLVIDAGWLDDEAAPLGCEFRKTFRAKAADEVQPDPKNWRIQSPKSSTRDPLEIRFPESMDRALIESALMLLDPKGLEVAGRLAIDEGETRWRFTPDNPWSEGDYTLEIDNELEDLAGNSIRRPFEVDIQRDTPVRPEMKRISLPIPIRAGAP